MQHREHHSRSNQRKTNKYIKFAGCEECRHYRNSKDARIRIVFPMRLSEKRCQIRSYRICDIISASVCLLASKEPLILIVRTSFGEVSPELDAGTEAWGGTAMLRGAEVWLMAFEDSEKCLISPIQIIYTTTSLPTCFLCWSTNARTFGHCECITAHTHCEFG